MAGLKSDWRWERKRLWEFAHNLCRGDDGALLGRERGESLRELSVTIALARVRRDEELLRGCEFGGELGAVAAVGMPDFDDGNAKDERQRGGDKFYPKLGKHNRCSKRRSGETLQVEILRRTLSVRLKMTSCENLADTGSDCVLGLRAE